MIIILFLLLTAFFASIGSFINVIAYRLVHPLPFFTTRSHCPTCHTVIAWYDLVPVLSWLALRGRCRSCHQYISFLYPFIELLTIACGWLLILTQPPLFWFGYGIFIVALLVTIRTDLETMLISRLVTIYLIPVAWLLSYTGLLPLPLAQSLIGTCTGSLFIWLVGFVFYQLTGRIGMGQGDIDLLAFIGAFLGPWHSWRALLSGSLLGSIVGIIISIIKGSTWNRVLPFGPFLAAGALMTLLFV